MPYSRFVQIGAIAFLLGATAAATMPPVNVVAITQWLPVTDEERNLKAPTIDPDAGAEALFWRIHILDNYQAQGEQKADVETILYHSMRIKVFNKRGVESQSTRSIEYFGKRIIVDVAGRTIKPDGTIVELKKDAIFQRDVVKASGLKVKAVSFAMPAVEPGAILDYRWKEVRPGEDAHYMRLRFSQDIPVHETKYFVKPLEIASSPMRWAGFGAHFDEMVQERDGFSSTFLRNVPALKDEPLMPSEWSIQPWILVYYGDQVNAPPDKFWASEGKKMYSRHEMYMKASGDVREAADAAAAGAKDQEEKLAKLLLYCRGRIKRFGDEDVTERQREKAKENNSPSDTLKRGIGSGFDVNMLFAAMARAEGFDVRVARLSPRNDIIFNHGYRDRYFLPALDIAVKVGDQWRFYDAAAKTLPIGMVSWSEEGAEALITDPKQPVFVPIPYSAAEKSLTARTGTFELDDQGTLQGQVRLAYTGHAASVRREEGLKRSAAQREDDIRDMVHAQYSTAEVSDVTVENMDDAEKPLTVSYKVKVPGYAQRTGKRLFLQAGYFQRGQLARFTAGDRKYDVWFEYPWAEQDHIEIKTPAGFALEDPETPRPIDLGPLGEYRVTAKAGAQQLTYERTMAFGREGRLAFPQKLYPNLKELFDTIHQSDQQSLTLRQKPASVGAAK